jgi:hypothetical protein
MVQIYQISSVGGVFYTKGAFCYTKQANRPFLPVFTRQIAETERITRFIE